MLRPRGHRFPKGAGDEKPESPLPDSRRSPARSYNRGVGIRCWHASSRTRQHRAAARYETIAGRRSAAAATPAGDSRKGRGARARRVRRAAVATHAPTLTPTFPSSVSQRPARRSTRLSREVLAQILRTPGSSSARRAPCIRKPSIDSATSRSSRSLRPYHRNGDRTRVQSWQLPDLDRRGWRRRVAHERCARGQPAVGVRQWKHRDQSRWLNRGRSERCVWSDPLDRFGRGERVRRLCGRRRDLQIYRWWDDVVRAVRQFAVQRPGGWIDCGPPDEPGHFVRGHNARRSRRFLRRRSHREHSSGPDGSHVFEVVYNAVSGTATWTSRDGSGDGFIGDLPVTSVVFDARTGDLYAATDFGVLRAAGGTNNWTLAAAGMPKVEVSGLTLVTAARKLYAATHGLSAWKLDLPD
jgi:hypothetical protein